MRSIALCSRRGQRVRRPTVYWALAQPKNRRAERILHVPVTATTYVRWRTAPPNFGAREWRMHYIRATLADMKSSTLPAVRVEPELRAELEAVLGEAETISTFVADAVRRAVEFRRVQADFHARGEAAWQDYLRTGVSHPVNEVFDRVQARIDARRRELQSRST